MKTIDFTKLKGEDLFWYFTKDYPDEDYSSVVRLLPYATMDFEKAYEILERIVREGKKLVAVYPLLEETDTSKMEYVGSIMDGDLYIE